MSLSRKLHSFETLQITRWPKNGNTHREKNLAHWQAETWLVLHITHARLKHNKEMA